MADTPTGETVTPVAPSNEPGITTDPTQDNRSADVEAAKREAEQARIRANQLENEVRKFKEQQEAAERKTLEEKEEFKQLYEQLKSQIDERDAKDAEQTRTRELQTATESIYKDYSEAAVELAKVAGLSLSDDSEAAQAALKQKLDVFQKQVGTPTASPTSNNPHNPAPAATDRKQLVQRNGDGVSPMALAGAKGDESVIKSYIAQLPAIQRMKELANGA